MVSGAIELKMIRSEVATVGAEYPHENVLSDIA